MPIFLFFKQKEAIEIKFSRFFYKLYYKRIKKSKMMYSTKK